MNDDVIVRVEGHILVVVMNRPAARNAITKSLAEAMSAQWDRLDADASLRCAILTGAGGTFCSGMDLKDFLKSESPGLGDRGLGGLKPWSRKKPVIAAVDGYALAGGFELAIGCDLIVANKDAKFGIPEAKRGLVAAGGGVVRLPRLVGRQIAMEMALTGEPIGASRAYELGLVNRVVDGPAIEGAMSLAVAISDCGPLAVSASKAVIRDSWLWSDEELNVRQAPYVSGVFSSDDAKEGARAFAEKRKPEWQGS